MAGTANTFVFLLLIKTFINSSPIGIEANQQNFIQRHAYALAIVVLAAVLVLGIGTKFSFVSIGKPALSSHILALTSPIYSLSGNVVSVGNSSFTIQYTPAAGQIIMSVPSSSAPVAPQQEQPFTYTVNIISKTQITRMSGNIVPSAQPGSASASAAALSIRDIKVHDFVRIASAVDLRTLQSDAFDATLITLPSTSRTLSGTITAVGDNSVTVHGTVAGAMAGGSQPATLQDYVVLIDQNTKISSISVVPAANASQPQQPALSISGLKKDMRVSIMFDALKQSGTTITAAVITELGQQALPVP